MAYILHIDTSSAIGAIALAYNGDLKQSFVLEDARQQAAVINTGIEQTCSGEGVSLQELSAIAVVSGPGSYTGLRIGLATAKALCYALDIPLIMQDKLTLISGFLEREYDKKYDYYGAALSAREGEFYFTLNEIQPPCHITSENLALILKNLDGSACICCDTEAMQKTKSIALTAYDGINLKYWCAMAYIAFGTGIFTAISNAEPLYLKQVFIQQSKK